MDNLNHKSAANWIAVGIVVVAVVAIGYSLLHAHSSKPSSTSSSSTTANTAAAGAAHLYLSPTTSSVASGSTLTVQVRENSADTPVNAVEADFSYPADKLVFVSINDTGSAFGVKAVGTGSAGKVTIARGSTTSLKGDQAVASVTFNVQPGSGTAALTFLPSSTIVSSTTNKSVLSTTSGGNYQIK